MDGSTINVLCRDRRRGFCNQCRRFVMWATDADTGRRVPIRDDAEPGEIIARGGRSFERLPVEALHTRDHGVK